MTAAILISAMFWLYRRQEEKLIQSHIEGSDDGFNFLRKKQKLDSESDQLLRK